ncbi:glycerophosphodiester phosphodiesterase [Kocuria sp. JC486]|nr:MULTISPECIES: glycerophosphodiester phosphodiesterase family protein [Kocuria]NHU85829.1 glycerophosphodiester phosphodiesterase [Kocuria sp. JC486]
MTDSNQSRTTDEFELQAHRAGRGHWTENSLHATGRSLDTGVGAVEVDTQLTRDGVVVVWHDSTLQADKCRDTGPVTDGDPAYPYVGDHLRDLTLEQIQSVDCGFQPAPGFPDQEVVTGHRIAPLSEFLALARERGAESMWWNIEIKIEDPSDAAERNLHTDAVLQEVYAAGDPGRTQIQSFDWAVLDRVAVTAPEVRLGALATAKNPSGAGQNPQEVARRGYDVWVPNHTIPSEDDIAEAHDLGLKVVPWTVNDASDMQRLMDWGVDGLITDYPWQLREIMAQRGMSLPSRYPAV